MSQTGLSPDTVWVMIMPLPGGGVKGLILMERAMSRLHVTTSQRVQGYVHPSAVTPCRPTFVASRLNFVLAVGLTAVGLTGSPSPQHPNHQHTHHEWCNDSPNPSRRMSFLEQRSLARRRLRPVNELTRSILRPIMAEATHLRAVARSGDTHDLKSLGFQPFS